jgi:hypothetical protein
MLDVPTENSWLLIVLRLAHAVMENNQTIGKLVLVVNHDR